MGTSWSLQAVAPPPHAAHGVQAALDRVVAQMSQWEPHSDLSRFNRAAPDAWQALPHEFATVLGAALDVARASGGAFDPCLGRLTELWGFGAAGAVAAVPGAGPLDAARRDDRTINYDPDTRRARRSAGAMLDLSGIAKGFGVDHAAEWLLAAGVRHFLIEVGGELRGEGLRPDGQPWWVDVETPPEAIRQPYRGALHDLSIATSGSYRRGFAVDGQHFSHSLDPRTGWPIIHGVRSVTVVHRSCMLADAWATALTVMGADTAMRCADEHGLAACAIVDEREYLSQAWRDMLG